MKSNLQFDFLIDKENSSLTIVREFNAARQLVWDCYTKPELLDQWFSPKPFSTKTKSMDFKNGGHWHYAMIDPEGTEYWGYTEYYEVNPIDYYRTIDSFCDSKGSVNHELPTANWKVTFNDKSKNATVTTVVNYDSLKDLETVINMGMEEGMLSTLEKLDELLVSFKK